jgi:hypothetical protein
MSMVGARLRDYMDAGNVGLRDLKMVFDEYH